MGKGEENIKRPSPLLSRISFSPQGAHLPLLPVLFGIYDSGHRLPRGGSRPAKGPVAGPAL